MGREASKSTDYRVTYNPDCKKWMVMRYGNLDKDCMGDRWEQVCLSNRPAYTKYRKVACRWLLKIKEARNE